MSAKIVTHAISRYTDYLVSAYFPTACSSAVSSTAWSAASLGLLLQVLLFSGRSSSPIAVYLFRPIGMPEKTGKLKKKTRPPETRSTGTGTNRTRSVRSQLGLYQMGLYKIKKRKTLNKLVRSQLRFRVGDFLLGTNIVQ